MSITLTLISAGNDASDYINTGEITSVRNADTGNDASNDDKDSTPDAIEDNDAGGAVDSPSDDAIDGNGTGANGDTDPATDEDDSDVENVEIFDLALTKTTDVTAPVRLGQEIPFTITVFNQGNITATDITVNDYIQQVLN